MITIDRFSKQISAGVALLLCASWLNARADSDGFRQINLVSDQPGQARFTDPNSLNAWGLTFAFGDLFVVDNHAGVASFYRPSGHSEDLVLRIPSPAGPDATSAPTDLAFNESALFLAPHFQVMVGTESLPSLAIFVTEDGTIASWVPFRDSHQVVIAVDNSAAGAVYKGVALAHTHKGSFLYAANFHQGFVEMYDQHFNLVKTFTDSTVPADFAPFGIRFIGGHLYVTFAKQRPPDNADDQAGPGLGYVDVFDTEGNLVRRFASEGTLNAPWGMTLAPRHFGRFSNALLVGNFGDGRINAYHPRTGAFLGQLQDRHGNPIEIDGLWGLAFNPNSESDNSALYFTAGPNDEDDGLVGLLRPEHH